MKVTAVAVSAIFVASTLAGCGGGSAYCDALQEADEEFASLDEGNFGEMDNALDRIQELADEAPSEIEEEWTILDGAITDLRAALDDAGITFADLGGIQSGELPEGFDEASLTELATELQQLGSAEFEEASITIEEHAQDECDIDLSGDAEE